MQKRIMQAQKDRDLSDGVTEAMSRMCFNVESDVLFTPRRG